LARKVVVIGAGAAGLMAAGKAAERGLNVTLIEKNDRVGKKILISGKGRCNITNASDIKEFIENIPGNGNFLYSAFYNFSNEDLIRFFSEYGLKTKVERGGRVFPQSDRSKDVVDALSKYINKYNVKLLLKSPVHSIQADKGKVRSVMLKDGRIIDCDSIILATGGISYPGTGSTGDGYKMAKSLGHTILELKPSLVPLVTGEPWIKELQGLSLRNISISVVNNDGKKIYSDFGELLFTHFGVSGPVILSCSRHLLKYNYSGVRLIIDLKPALSERKLYERVHRDFDKFSRKQYKNSLDELLPQKLIPVIIKLSGIPPDKFVNQISREERKNLVDLMKSLTLNITGSRPIEEAIITVGGVSTNEINPSTMESKLIKGLFFAGEIVDVDGYTGGYNLTIAFSTGHLAGASC
jgi:predicted Rossmann fold flavoprotein